MWSQNQAIHKNKTVAGPILIELLPVYFLVLLFFFYNFQTIFIVDHISSVALKSG